jgi:hypothetical protein
MAKQDSPFFSSLLTYYHGENDYKSEEELLADFVRNTSKVQIIDITIELRGLLSHNFEDEVLEKMFYELGMQKGFSFPYIVVEGQGSNTDWLNRFVGYFEKNIGE